MIDLNDPRNRKVFFPKQKKAHDFLKMRGKWMRRFLVSTIIVGQLALGLWRQDEQMAPGAQRSITYVHKGKKKDEAPQIIAVNVYFTSSGTWNRDQYLPGWPGTSNTIDCIGGGGGGCGGTSGGGYGGGGGGLARYNNLGQLGATFATYMGGGGAGNSGSSDGLAGGNTQFDNYVGAYGGGGARYAYYGGAGGTYYAGQGSYTGGSGGTDFNNYGYGGGGGGAAGRYGGGGNGLSDAQINGGNGGPSGGGAGGNGLGYNGSNGNEYQAGVGSGGGGAGGGPSASNGGNGGYYGGGGGGSGRNMIGGNGAQGLIAIVYTPYTAPVVSSISPNAGPTSGGQSVAISGSGFYNVTSVNIGGAPLTGMTYNANAIYGTTSAGGAGTYNVNVNVSGGVGAGAGVNLYTYVAPPTLSSCAPNMGPDIGGTAVTITGARFTGGTGVTFGGVAATSVVVVNATTITCRTPAHAFGLVNVSISSGYGTADLIGGFTYLPPSGGFNMPMMGI